MIADNYLIQSAEMEQIFFFSFPFLLRIRYNIAVRALYRQCFLIYCPLPAKIDRKKVKKTE